MKTVFSFDPTTLAYAGTTVAQESPVRPGDFFTPAHATDVAPPEALVGFTRHFKDGEWQQWPIVSVPTEPGVEPSIEDVRASHVAMIERQRDQLIGQPFEFDGHAWPSDSAARADLSQHVTMAAADPDYVTELLTSDDAAVELTAEKLIALGRAALDHKKRYTLQARQLRERIAAATTVDDVQAVSW